LTKGNDWLPPLGEDDPDVTRHFAEIVTSRGYKLSTHHINTKDGYIIKAYNIYPTSLVKTKPYPIVLMHGVFDSSDSQVSNSDDRNLPYILSKTGYDVWLLNCRGNKHSKHHTTLKTDDPKFWDYSYSEIGQFDVMDSIEYILKDTKTEKVIYVGHSQGGAALFSAASLHPEFFVKNVKSVIAMAPAVFLDHSQSDIIKTVAKFQIDWMLKKMGYHELFPSAENFNWICYMVCKLAGDNCQNLANIAISAHKEDENLERAHVLITHYPAGSSLKTLTHFIQVYRAQKFQDYDYGEDENMTRYGQKTPPEFPLQNYPNISTHILTGEHDDTVPPIDVQKLVNILGSKVTTFDYLKNYSHASFVIGKGYDHVNLVSGYIEKESSS